jgi:hypothetical protein
MPVLTECRWAIQFMAKEAGTMPNLCGIQKQVASKSPIREDQPKPRTLHGRAGARVKFAHRGPMHRAARFTPQYTVSRETRIGLAG